MASFFERVRNFEDEIATAPVEVFSCVSLFKYSINFESNLVNVDRREYQMVATSLLATSCTL